MRVVPFIATGMMTLAAAALFLKGWRERRAVAGTNVFIERDRNPVFYWIAQSGYLCAIACFGSGVWLAAAGRSVAGGSLADKLIMSTWGSAFLFGAVMIGFVFVNGLRSGVADSRFGDIKRAKSPIRYWAMQALYVFMICLTTALGASVFLVVFLK